MKEGDVFYFPVTDNHAKQIKNALGYAYDIAKQHYFNSILELPLGFFTRSIFPYTCDEKKILKKTNKENNAFQAFSGTSADFDEILDILIMAGI